MAVDRNQLMRMRLFAKLHPKLTRASREVFQEMLSLFGIHGKLYPSHATLAKRARCGEKTVRRAIKQLEQLGVVSWTRRRRKPNVYRVCFDAASLVTLRPVEPVQRHRGRASGPLPDMVITAEQRESRVVMADAVLAYWR